MNAFATAFITPYFILPNDTFWDKNVVMVDTWVKAGESKFVYANNEIDALGKSDVINIKNPTHPLNVYTPYFFMQNGGNLIIKAANTSYITAQIGNNNNNIVQVEKGAGLYIVPK